MNTQLSYEDGVPLELYCLGNHIVSAGSCEMDKRYGKSM